jgi:hypothetical protein
MNRGIYIIANDKVTDQAIALLNSIRLHDADTPVIMIPYDDNYHAIADTLNKYYGVKIYEDLDFIDRLSLKLHETFGGKFLHVLINFVNKLAGLAHLMNFCTSIQILLFLKKLLTILIT